MRTFTTCLAVLLFSSVARVRAQLPHAVAVGGAGVVGISKLADVTGALPIGAFGLSVPITAELSAERGQAYFISAEHISWRGMHVRLSGGLTRSSLRGEAHAPLINISVRNAGQVSVWSAAADALIPLVQWNRVAPFAAVGVGAQHWQLRQLDSLLVVPSADLVVNVEPVDATTVTGTVGAGLDITLNRAVGFRVELQDQMAADPLKDQDITFTRDITGTARPRNMVHVVRLTAGLTFALH